MLGVQHERGPEDRHLAGRRLAAGDPLEQGLGDRAVRPGAGCAAAGEIDPGGEDRGCLAEEPFGLGDQGGPRPRGVVMLHEAEHADRGPQGVHHRRLGARGRESGESVEHGGIHRAGGCRDPVTEGGEFGVARQFAAQQEEGHLLEITRRGEGLDVVAAIPQGAVERADGGLAGDHAGEPLGEVGGGFPGGLGGGHVSCSSGASRRANRWRSGCFGS